MASDRLETLKQFLESRPDDCFVRYGLAQEYVKAEQFEAAITQFDKILEIDQNYQAAYYHAGKTYEKMGRIDDARAMWERGVETSHRTGDAHARGELEAALDATS